MRKYFPYINYINTEDNGVIVIGVEVPLEMAVGLHDEDKETWATYLRSIDEQATKIIESDMPDMFSNE